MESDVASEGGGTFQKIFSGALLLTGTSVGAGMLGIPLVTASAGFIPAVCITVIVWLFMLLTGLLLLEASLQMPVRSNFLSISEYFLGKWGKWATGGLFAFLYMFLMVAYLAAGGPLLADGLRTLFPIMNLSDPMAILLFTLLFGSVVAISPKSIDRVNVGLTLLMFASLALLIGLGSQHVESQRLMPYRFGSMFIAMPILFSAFGYHNLIPSLVTYFNKDRFVLRLSIILGTTIPLLIYLVWQWLIIGCVSQEQISATLAAGKPVTGALQAAIHSPWTSMLGRMFGFLAIATSTLGVAFSLVDFLGDGLKIEAKRYGRLVLTGLTFIPPMLMTWINPTIFDKALGIAGGVGESLINGLLPIMLVWTLRYAMQLRDKTMVPGGKKVLLFLGFFSLFVLGIEVYSLLS